jgi:hypothetical protein
MKIFKCDESTAQKYSDVFRSYYIRSRNHLDSRLYDGVVELPAELKNDFLLGVHHLSAGIIYSI